MLKKKIKDFIRISKILKIKNRNVAIGNNYWIGANVLSIKEIKICSNVIISANNIVTKYDPLNCLIGDVPARVIKSK